MKLKTLAASASAAVASLAASAALAAPTTGAVDVSGVDTAPFLATAQTLFVDHIPTIVALGGIGLAIGVVVTMIRRAKGVAR